MAKSRGPFQGEGGRMLRARKVLQRFLSCTLQQRAIFGQRILLVPRHCPAKRFLQVSGRWWAPSPPTSFPLKRLGSDHAQFLVLSGYPKPQSVGFRSLLLRTRREPAPRRKLRRSGNNDLNMRKNERSEKFQDGTCSNGTGCRIKLLAKMITKQEFVN